MTFVKGETPEGAKPFQPGESGNPNGRPKGKSFKTILNELLDMEASEADLSDEEIKKLFPSGKVTNREIFMTRMLLRAKSDPDSKSAERLLNRVDGLPKQSIDHTTAGESLNQQIIINPVASVQLSKTEAEVDTAKAVPEIVSPVITDTATPVIPAPPTT